MIAENLPLALKMAAMLKRVKQWLMPSSSLHGIQQRFSGLCSCDGAPAGRFYNLPHGVCNAVLLPHVQVSTAKSPLRVCVTVLLLWA